MIRGPSRQMSLHTTSSLSETELPLRLGPSPIAWALQGMLATFPWGSQGQGVLGAPLLPLEKGSPLAP